MAMMFMIISLVVISLTISLTPSPMLVSSSSTPCNISSEQYDALHALYTSTNGTGWSKGCKNWVFSSTNPDYSAPCNGWYGIEM